MTMKIDSTHIDDTFAEAFPMKFVRLIVTAEDSYWLEAALREFCGYSSSVIACDAETGCERAIDPDESPDGRVAAAVLAFGFSADALAKSIGTRVGQCLMTCPTTAVFDGYRQAEQFIPLGKSLRFFGDGFQKSKVIQQQRFWRVPVMDGEFLVEERLGVGKGVGGGNLIIQAEQARHALAAARRAAESLVHCDQVITPFPGGIARSGSKVGSRYKGLVASTADAYCPTLRGRVESRLHPKANCAYEIVIDGTSEQAVADAMRTAMHAAAGEGVLAISAGNYGGKLGKYHFQLRELTADS